MKLGLEAVTLRFQVRVMAGKKLVWSGIRPLQQVDLLRDKVNLFNVVKFELNPVCGCRNLTVCPIFLARRQTQFIKADFKKYI